MSVYAGSHVGNTRPRGKSMAGPRAWVPAIAAVLAVALSLLVVLLVAGGRRGGETVAPGAQSLHEAARLPLGERAQLSTAAGAAGAAFAVHAGPAGTLTAAGRGIDSSFGTSGVTIRSAHARVGLSPATLEGRSTSTAPSAAANRVSYHGAGLSEWYANGPFGLEQGFTVARAPSAGRALQITFCVSGSRPSLSHGRVSLGGGLLYGGLSATDASGRRLPARVELRGSRIVLAVDAVGARFPVHVDPLVFQETLAGDERAGSNLAISADGNTALVGGTGQEPGAVDVFVRNGTVWTLQQKLSPGGANDHNFGHQGEGQGDAVALSGDGNTAMIVAHSGEKDAQIWTYTRSNGVWTPYSTTLAFEERGATQVAKEDYGDSIALSYNGETAAVSDPGDACVFILHRTGSSWTTAASIGDVGPQPESDEWGWGIALSGDGRNLLIGAPGGYEEGITYDHAVFFYGEEAGKWNEQGRFEYPNYDGEAPVALALDREGDTAIVGEYLGGTENLGAARVYTRSGSTWSLQASLKRTSAGDEGDEFGMSVGLSEQGNRAMVESRGGESGGPAAWEYTRSGSAWTQQGQPLETQGFLPGQVLGFAFSGDGHTLILIPEPGTAPRVYVNDATVGAAAASEVTPTAALLSASVNPAGEAVTSCRFEYGATTSYGSTAACSPKPESQTTPVAVSAALKGLAASHTYHFRVAVTTAAGTIYDSDATFTTFAEAATAKTEEASKPATAQLGALSAVASGGTGAVTVASYGSNPGPAPLPGSTGGYADIYRSNTASFTEVEFKDCEVGDARTLWFYGSGGWQPAQPAATFSEGCGIFKASATSRPSVAELIGLKSKWGEPPGEFGQCEKGSAAIYAEAGCLTVHEKKGVPDGKGKYEWLAAPIGCHPMKKGRYSEALCHTADEAKGKGKGSYEAGSTSFTGSAVTPKLAVSGAASIECSAGNAVGELTAAEKGTETLQLTGCSQSGAACTSPADTSGTIQTSPLETISYEEGGSYLLALTAVQLAQFQCGSTSYTLTGAVAGTQTGDVNSMSTKSSVAFAAGEGAQQLVVHTGTQEHTATLTMTQSNVSSQALELDSSIASGG